MTGSPRSRKGARISDSLERQLNMYALAAAAAGVGALALVQPVEAKIVYTPAHGKVGKPLPMDLNHDGIVDFYLILYGHYNWTGLAACQYLGTGFASTPCASQGSNAIRSIVSSRGKWAAALRYGAKIGRGQPFRKRWATLGEISTSPASDTADFYGPWLNRGKGVKDRYLGIEFKIKGQFHFGWARITVTTTPVSFAATLTGYAYETVPNKAIIAGKTKGPDVITLPADTAPGSLGNLALGRK